jgi:hypothetical protein
MGAMGVEIAMGVEVGDDAGRDVMTNDGLQDRPSAVEANSRAVAGPHMPAMQSVRHATQFQDPRGVVYPRSFSSSTSDFNSTSDNPVTAFEELDND